MTLEEIKARLAELEVELSRTDAFKDKSENSSADALVAEYNILISQFDKLNTVKDEKKYPIGVITPKTKLDITYLSTPEGILKLKLTNVTIGDNYTLLDGLSSEYDNVIIGTTSPLGKTILGKVPGIFNMILPNSDIIKMEVKLS